jgi:peroxiredoxin
LREAYPQFTARNVALLSVSSTDLEMTSFIAETLRAPYPLLADPQWRVFYQYGVGSVFGVPLPAVLLINAAGVIRRSWYAPLSPVFTPPGPATLLGWLDETA